MVMGLMLLFLSCSESENKNKDAEQETIKPVSFTVIGDVPYGDVQRDGLIALVNTHNTITSSEFVVHVGDIKRGADPCNEAVYADVSSILKAFTTPTFMLLGDNEYNDCSDPIATGNAIF